MPYQFIGFTGPKLEFKNVATGSTEPPTFSKPLKGANDQWYLFSEIPENILYGYSEPEPEPEPVTQGNTTVEEEPEPTTHTSVYGKTLVQSRKYKAPEGDSRTEGIHEGEAVRSYFNKWTLFKYKNISGLSEKSQGSEVSDRYSTVVNSTSPYIAPTANNIVQYSENIDSLAFKYDLEDFIQCEHYGQISNSYMVTLRRFGYPIADNLIEPRQIGPGGDLIDTTQPDIARAITWLSPALGNDLKEILKFNVKIPWKEEESAVQTIQAGKKNRGAVGAMIDGSPIFQAIENGINGYNADQTQRANAQGGGFDPLKETYPNTVYGPLNVIKNIMAREQGLKFEQEFKLTFHYDLRGYPNTSPKVAFMDTMANLLALTYNNAPFWGGAVRYTGSGSLGKPFGDYSLLAAGDYEGFLKGLGTQISNAVSTGFADLQKAWETGNLGDSKILNNVIGGGLMKLFNGPQGGSIVNSLLTGDPTGQWHLTIGNPLNPIMMIGNLACTDSNFSFEGPFGYEDFPSKLKVEITLKPARMRDKGEIESMFNAGKGRMYLQPEYGADIDNLVNVSAYGNKDRLAQGFNEDAIQKLSDMSAG